MEASAVEEDANASGARAGKRPPGSVGQLLRGRFGPLVAGLMLDVVDFTTFGPLGVRFGLIIGFFAGLTLARALGYPRRSHLAIAIGAGLYCMLPPTTFLPLAGLLGAAARVLGCAPDQVAARSRV